MTEVQHMHTEVVKLRAENAALRDEVDRLNKLGSENLKWIDKHLQTIDEMRDTLATKTVKLRDSIITIANDPDLMNRLLEARKVLEIARESRNLK